MKKAKLQKLVALVAVCILLVGLAACNGSDKGTGTSKSVSGNTGDVSEFASKAAGTWYRNGNLRDEKLEVLSDGEWTQQSLEEGEWVTIAQGTTGYDENESTFEFIDDMSNKVYLVDWADDEKKVLNFVYDFYRSQDSINGFEQYNGKWYLNADRDSDYYSFEDGKWQFYEDQGMASVSVDSGYLVWDGVRGKLLAQEYPDAEPFAEFICLSEDELQLDDESYVLMEDLTLEDLLDDEDNSEDEVSPLLFSEFYYLNGEVGEPSWYFYDDSDVDYDYDDTTIEATYVIEDDEIIISSDGETLSTLTIVDSTMLVDYENGDVYSISEILLSNFFLNEFYYLNGEVGEPSLYFFDDGDVDYDYDDTTVEATYIVEDYNIIISLSGETLFSLTIVDVATLYDTETGDTYAIYGY